jgi:hypothetical protein
MKALRFSISLPKPSLQFYIPGGASSLHDILIRGLRDREERMAHSDFVS